MDVTLAPPGGAGVTLGRPPSPLVERAAELLAGGPMEPALLVAAVCRIPVVAPAMADHLAIAMLGADDRFLRQADGRWALVARVGAVAAPLEWRTLELEPYVVVDVETTGARALGGDRVTEVAVVRVDASGVTTVFDTLVNPRRPIPPYITALTRITSEMVRHAPPFEEIAPQLSGVLEGQVFVAHNVAFDWRFLSMEMERATGRPLIGRRLCTVKMARRLMPFLRRRSLDVLSAHFQIENPARHRAGGDATATAHVLRRLLDQARSAGCSTLHDLETLMKPVRRARTARRRALPHSVPVADAG